MAGNGNGERHTMYELFKEKAEGVGAEVHRYAKRGEALDGIIGLVRSEGAADAPGGYTVWAPGQFLQDVGTKPLRDIPGLRLEVTRELAAAARIGISEMAWGVADTGTLVQDSTAVVQRLVSTLPLIHIALLPTDNILPDMPGLLERIRPETSGYIAMISGPSRTADIERVLTIGVHGPERLVIVCIDEPGGVNR
jgi:L-lactate dehydrogenase complex protein LldG